MSSELNLGINPRAGIQKLVWKESIQQLPIWITLFVLTMVFVAIVMMTNSLEKSQTIALIVGAFSGVYAVAAASMLFSNEREIRTDTFLQMLPVSPSQLGLVKFGVGLVMVFGFALLAGLVIFPFVQSWLRLIPPDDMTAGVAQVILGGYFLPIIELYVYTVICSTLVRRTVVAAISGIVLMAIVFLGCGALSEAIVMSTPEWWYDSLVGIWLYRIGFFVVATAIAAGLCSRWISVDFKDTSRFSAQNKWTWTGPAFARIHRLAWQSCHQIGRSVLLCAVVFVIGGVLFYPFAGLAQGRAYDGKLGIINGVPDVFQLMLVLCIGVCACWTFAADQAKKQRLFFVQQFENARFLWAARNIGWLVFLTLFVGVVYLVLLLIDFFLPADGISVFLHVSRELLYERDGGYYLISDALTKQLVATLILGLATFSVGQFFSMLIRQPILCPIFALIGSFALFLWQQEMRWLQLELYWSVLPISLGFFLATWWYAPTWLTGESRIANYWKPVTAVLVPLMLIVLWIPKARWDQVPTVGYHKEVSLRIANLTSENAIATAEAYKNAIQSFRNDLPVIESNDNPDATQWIERDIAEWPAEILNQFVADNLSVFEQLEKAAEAEFCYPFLEDDPQAKTKSLEMRKVYQIYAAKAEQALRDDQLANSIEYYKKLFRVYAHITSYRFDYPIIYEVYHDIGRWANHPKQDLDSIRDAIQWLRERPFFKANACDWYVTYKMFDENQDGDLSRIVGDAKYDWRRSYLWNIPGEKARARKLAIVLANHSGLFPSTQMESEYAYNYRNWARYSNQSQRDAYQALWAKKSSAIDFKLFDSIRGRGWNWAQSYYRLQQTNRDSPFQQNQLRLWTILQAKLCLIEYKLAKGSYPDSIQQLLDEYWLEIDPSGDRNLRKTRTFDSRTYARIIFFDDLMINLEIEPNGLNQKTFVQFEQPLQGDEYDKNGLNRHGLRETQKRMVSFAAFAANQPFMLDIYFEASKNKKLDGYVLHSEYDKFTVADDDGQMIRFLRFRHLYDLPRAEKPETEDPPKN